MEIRAKAFCLGVVTLLLTVALAMLTLSAVAQNIAIIGHSFADRECHRWYSDGMPGRIACAWYDGATCAQLLRTLPSDLAGLARGFGRAPDVVIAWVGTNDVIQAVPVASFEQCAASYQRTIESTFPGATLVYANVPPMSYLEPYGSWVARLIEEYNAGLRPPMLDVWSATVLPNGWANPALIPVVHPSAAGWKVIEGLQLQLIQRDKP